MRWTLACWLFLACPALAQPTVTIEDSDLRVTCLSEPRQIDEGPDKFLWSCGNQNATCVYGYTVVGEAKARIKWRVALLDYTNSIAQSMHMKVLKRRPFNPGSHQGYEIIGKVYDEGDKAWLPARVRTSSFPGGARIYFVTGSGQEADVTRFVSSFRGK